MNASGVGANQITQQNISNDLDAARYVQRALMMLNSLNVIDQGGRQRVTIDAFGVTATLPVVTTVGTVSSVTSANMTQFVNVGSRYFVDQSKFQFNGIRRAIYG